MGAGWMNMASLCLGILAWVLPMIAMIVRKKAAGRICPMLVWASAMSCAAALYFQICYQSHLVKIHDISAILDTTDSLVFVAGVLIAVTIMLDMFAIVVCWCEGRGKSTLNA